MLMCTLAWHLYQTRKLLPFQIWHKCIPKVKHIYSLSEWTGILVGKSLINSLWSPVNILFIINIQTSSTGWTYITLWGCFFFTCHNGCPVCKESRWKLKLGAREGAPGGLVPSPPQPLSPMKWSSGLAKGPILHLVSAGGVGGLQYSQSLLPSTLSLLQRMVPKCQHVPPGLTHACPHCWGGGGQRGAHSPLTVTPWSKDWLVDWLRYR